MNCPFCRHDDSRVIDSRVVEDGLQIRRRRECPECGQRFSTQETAILNVVKRSGVLEPFSRQKVINGVSKACQGRQVSEDDLAYLRFASVYRNFSSLADFEGEISLLREFPSVENSLNAITPGAAVNNSVSN